ncbi:MAG TPA: hypothetical protein VFG33_07445, partial [Kribbella sp.]|uniref:hypothetical protein n=1 Tax=Kribbella sp. TaxID=1871183 RepID=UPI002D776578
VPGPIWAPVSDSAGRAVTAQSDSVPSPEPSAPEAEQPPAAGRVVNNYIYASSNLAIDSTDVKQTMKPPATGGSEKPAEQLQHPASLSSAPDEALARGSHPAMVLVVSVVGAFGIVPAVIQATKATWAQITSASLVVLTVALLVLCWFQWNRRPRARKAGLVIAAVFALGIGAVLILGNL